MCVHVHKVHENAGCFLRLVCVTIMTNNWQSYNSIQTSEHNAKGNLVQALFSACFVVFFAPFYVKTYQVPWLLQAASSFINRRSKVQIHVEGFYGFSVLEVQTTSEFILPVESIKLLSVSPFLKLNGAWYWMNYLWGMHSSKRIIWIHDSCPTERMTKAWHSTPNKATLSTFYFHPHQEAFGTASTFCLKKIFKYPGAQRKGQFQKLYLGGLKINCVCAHCILNSMSVLTVYLFLYHTCTSASKTLLDKAWNSKVTPLEGVSWRSIPSFCVPVPVATPTWRTSLLVYYIMFHRS